MHSPEEFEDKLAASKDKMVVLMCKATHCRPCKVRRSAALGWGRGGPLNLARRSSGASGRGPRAGSPACQLLEQLCGCQATGVAGSAGRRCGQAVATARGGQPAPGSSTRLAAHHPPARPATACPQLFSKTYAAAARQYKDAVFLEIMGDESKATRQMMINWCGALCFGGTAAVVCGGSGCLLL